MSLWQSFFGPSQPSQLDRVLDVLREDRAATSAMVHALIGAVTSQSELAKRQLDLLTAPQEPPRVRVMTAPTEAKYERAREARAAGATLDPDDMIASLTSEFSHHAASYD